jgi:GxxExxY protein
MVTNTDKPFLYKDLSYKIQGAVFNVRNSYGPSHKEIVYCNALAEEFKDLGIQFEREKIVSIKSLKTNKSLGIYRPDFVVENSILLEIKALSFTPKLAEDQLYYYLKNTNYELAYLINFGGEKLDIRRRILTNDKKK